MKEATEEFLKRLYVELVMKSDGLTKEQAKEKWDAETAKDKKLYDLACKENREAE